ncbi:double zinc ribbon domain-containing protein, partial [Rhodoplanes sp. SY1]|uniref:double zinc ribbon domain-containing protein n=1 Tax=Rhodoplanes sp. SY1 TaxID=3166646 RepID=UPI0038B64F8C
MATRATTARTGLRAALRLAVDAILPPLCPACGQPLTDDGAVCATCWSRLSFIARPYCDRLGIPLPHDAGPGALSARAIATQPAFGRARAAVIYDDVAGSLVHALKYGDRME